jgi:excisionase family DNA binding protein
VDQELRPLVLSVAEVAALLRVSPSTVWKAVKRRDIRSIRLGSRVLVPRGEIERLVGESAA